MSITVPTAGDPVVYSWGADVANQLNQFIPLCMAADVASTSSSFAGFGNVLTFAVVSGKKYNIQIVGTYTVGGTSTGLGIGYNHPGGTARVRVEINSTAVDDPTPEINWLTATDTAAGTSTTDSTAAHQFTFKGTYACTSDGTFALRANRNGSSTTVTIVAGTGGFVSVSA